MYTTNFENEQFTNIFFLPNVQFIITNSYFVENHNHTYLLVAA